MEKKYELTSETILHESLILHRIRALRDFGNVKAGDLGGFVESEYNLSHDGVCWIDDNAQVYGDARVCDKAWVHDNTQVYGHAIACGVACGVVRDGRLISRNTIVGEGTDVGEHTQPPKRFLHDRINEAQKLVEVKKTHQKAPEKTQNQPTLEK